MYQNLPLPQRLYLLCYTVDKAKFEIDNLQGRGQLLRAGAMVELARARSLGTEGRKVVRLDTEPGDDPFLVQVWNELPEKPKRWLHYLHAKAHTAERPVRDLLAGAGVLTLPERRGLSPLGSHHVTVEDPQQVAVLQKRARDAALSGADAADLPLDEVAMAVLTLECKTSSVFTKEERREHRETLKVLAAHFDTAVPGLRRALRNSFLSSRGTGGGWGN
ncbi:GPP34 family phosphoprotein [Actinomadura luteofluorescens]|uniref:GPP34 family phosphoprotein n=1 Tax=Actinomadura luteofluorescens TaxID=46163 RepID=A0A7Y9JK61_9ACTN|nr:GPP34 family phosphoprotein [Actinomadura luteofluorescens]NYD50094.1 hypothetical protein [Actinomadura luteofluorescens]